MLFQSAPAGRGFACFIFSALTALILGALSFAASANETADDQTSNEAPAQLSVWPDGAKPPFVLDELDRKPVALSDVRSDIVVVHFFATWCEPCRNELSALTRLVARSDPSRLRVLTISVAEVDVRVRNFIQKLPVNFPILLDRDRSVAKSWRVSALPTSFILDRDLKPRLFVERDYDWDRVDVAALVRSFSETTRHENRTTGTDMQSAHQPEPGERR